MPESICHGFKIEKERYRITDYEKFIREFNKIILWLFRHAIWKIYRIKICKEKWIGVHHAVDFHNLTYAGVLNSLGQCSCGKRWDYIECHLPSDLSDKVTMKSGRIARIEAQNEYI